MEAVGAAHKPGRWRRMGKCPNLRNMSRDKVLNFYLSAARQDRAKAAGGILPGILRAAEAAGWRVDMQAEDAPTDGDGYHLVYNRAVETPATLCLRRCYMDPFWRIEATNDRWDWQVASKPFEARPAYPEEEGFLNRWQRKLFAGQDIGEKGYIFMPLQGKLCQHRHFQSASPAEMIRATLQADPQRKIIATLHPGEHYTSDDMAMLAGFGDRFSISSEPSMALLAACDYAVTENSGMALKGFFAKKPAVLFARIDFQHIGAAVADLGVSGAFQKIADSPPPFATYLHWFFKRQSITSWADDAADQIRTRFRNHGWPM